MQAPSPTGTVSSPCDESFSQRSNESSSIVGITLPVPRRVSLDPGHTAALHTMTSHFSATLGSRGEPSPTLSNPQTAGAAQGVSAAVSTMLAPTIEVEHPSVMEIDAGLVEMVDTKRGGGKAAPLRVDIGTPLQQPSAAESPYSAAAQAGSANSAHGGGGGFLASSEQHTMSSFVFPVSAGTSAMDIPSLMIEGHGEQGAALVSPKGGEAAPAGLHQHQSQHLTARGSASGPQRFRRLSSSTNSRDAMAALMSNGGSGTRLTSPTMSAKGAYLSPRHGSQSLRSDGGTSADGGLMMRTTSALTRRSSLSHSDGILTPLAAPQVPPVRSASFLNLMMVPIPTDICEESLLDLLRLPSGTPRGSVQSSGDFSGSDVSSIPRKYAASVTLAPQGMVGISAGPPSPHDQPDAAPQPLPQQQRLLNASNTAVGPSSTLSAGPRRRQGSDSQRSSFSVSSATSSIPGSALAKPLTANQVPPSHLKSPTFTSQRASFESAEFIVDTSYVDVGATASRRDHSSMATTGGAVTPQLDDTADELDPDDMHASVELLVSFFLHEVAARLAIVSSFADAVAPLVVNHYESTWVCSKQQQRHRRGFAAVAERNAGTGHTKEPMEATTAGERNGSHTSSPLLLVEPRCPFFHEIAMTPTLPTAASSYSTEGSSSPIGRGPLNSEATQDADATNPGLMKNTSIAQDAAPPLSGSPNPNTNHNSNPVVLSSSASSLSTGQSPSGDDLTSHSCVAPLHDALESAFRSARWWFDESVQMYDRHLFLPFLTDPRSFPSHPDYVADEQRQHLTQPHDEPRSLQSMFPFDDASWISVIGTVRVGAVVLSTRCFYYGLHVQLLSAFSIQQAGSGASPQTNHHHHHHHSSLSSRRANSVGRGSAVSVPGPPPSGGTNGSFSQITHSSSHSSNSPGAPGGGSHAASPVSLSFAVAAGPPASPSQTNANSGLAAHAGGGGSPWTWLQQQQQHQLHFAVPSLWSTALLYVFWNHAPRSAHTNGENGALWQLADIPLAASVSMSFRTNTAGSPSVAGGALKSWSIPRGSFQARRDSDGTISGLLWHQQQQSQLPGVVGLPSVPQPSPRGNPSGWVHYHGSSWGQRLSMSGSASQNHHHSSPASGPPMSPPTSYFASTVSSFLFGIDQMETASRQHLEELCLSMLRGLSDAFHTLSRRVPTPPFSHPAGPDPKHRRLSASGDAPMIMLDASGSHTAASSSCGSLPTQAPLLPASTVASSFGGGASLSDLLVPRPRTATPHEQPPTSAPPSQDGKRAMEPSVPTVAVSEAAPLVISSVEDAGIPSEHPKDVPGATGGADPHHNEATTGARNEEEAPPNRTTTTTTPLRVEEETPPSVAITDSPAKLGPSSCPAAADLQTPGGAAAAALAASRVSSRTQDIFDLVDRQLHLLRQARSCSSSDDETNGGQHSASFYSLFFQEAGALHPFEHTCSSAASTDECVDPTLFPSSVHHSSTAHTTGSYNNTSSFSCSMLTDRVKAMHAGTTVPAHSSPPPTDDDEREVVVCPPIEVQHINGRPGSTSRAANLTSSMSSGNTHLAPPTGSRRNLSFTASSSAREEMLDCDDASTTPHRPALSVGDGDMHSARILINAQWTSNESNNRTPSNVQQIETYSTPQVAPRDSNFTGIATPQGSNDVVSPRAHVPQRDPAGYTPRPPHPSCAQLKSGEVVMPKPRPPQEHEYQRSRAGLFSDVDESVIKRPDEFVAAVFRLRRRLIADVLEAEYEDRVRLLECESAGRHVLAVSQHSVEKLCDVNLYYFVFGMPWDGGATMEDIQRRSVMAAEVSERAAVLDHQNNVLKFCLNEEVRRGEVVKSFVTRLVHLRGLYEALFDLCPVASPCESVDHSTHPGQTAAAPVSSATVEDSDATAPTVETPTDIAGSPPTEGEQRYADNRSASCSAFHALEATFRESVQEIFDTEASLLRSLLLNMQMEFVVTAQREQLRNKSGRIATALAQLADTDEPRHRLDLHRQWFSAFSVIAAAQHRESFVLSTTSHDCGDTVEEDSVDGDEAAVAEASRDAPLLQIEHDTHVRAEVLQNEHPAVDPPPVDVPPHPTAPLAQCPTDATHANTTVSSEPSDGCDPDAQMIDTSEANASPLPCVCGISAAKEDATNERAPPSPTGNDRTTAVSLVEHQQPLTIPQETGGSSTYDGRAASFLGVDAFPSSSDGQATTSRRPSTQTEASPDSVAEYFSATPEQANATPNRSSPLACPTVPSHYALARAQLFHAQHINTMISSSGAAHRFPFDDAWFVLMLEVQKIKADMIDAFCQMERQEYAGSLPSTSGGALRTTLDNSAVAPPTRSGGDGARSNYQFPTDASYAARFMAEPITASPPPIHPQEEQRRPQSRNVTSGPAPRPLTTTTLSPLAKGMSGGSPSLLRSVIRRLTITHIGSDNTGLTLVRLGGAHHHPCERGPPTGPGILLTTLTSQRGVTAQLGHHNDDDRGTLPPSFRQSISPTPPHHGGCLNTMASALSATDAPGSSTSTTTQPFCSSNTTAPRSPSGARPMTISTAAPTVEVTPQFHSPTNSSGTPHTTLTVIETHDAYLGEWHGGAPHGQGLYEYAQSHAETIPSRPPSPLSESAIGNLRPPQTTLPSTTGHGALIFADCDNPTPVVKDMYIGSWAHGKRNGTGYYVRVAPTSAGREARWTTLVIFGEWRSDTLHKTTWYATTESSSPCECI